MAGGTTSTTTTTAIPASRARRPSTLQYCLKSTATPRLAPPQPTPPDDRPTAAPDREVVAGDRPSTTVPRRQPAAAASPVAVWPTRIVAPKATPEDSLIDSCSTDGDEGPEYRLLSLAGDEIGHHLRATANTSHLDLLKRVSAPIADDDDDEFDVSEGRPVELCRDELPPASIAGPTPASGVAAAADAGSPDPFRYVDLIAARTVSVVNSCDATGFPQRRPIPIAPGHDRLVRSGTSLPTRLALSPGQSRSSTLPLAACGDSSSDTETLTPAASTRSSLSGIAAAATASTLTKKRSMTLPFGGAAGGGSAGRLTAADSDSPTAFARLSPDSPVSRFSHLGAHALDVFYSPGDDDDDDDDGDDAGVVSPLPPSTAVSGAGTFWRPVACTAAVDRRRRPASPPSLPQLIKRRSPPTARRRPRHFSPLPPPRPSAAPLVGVIEGFSDVEGASPSDEEDILESTIRPPRPTGLTPVPSVLAAAQLSSTELQQSSRSCSKPEVSGSQSSWLTMPVDSSSLHRDGHSPATDIVWPSETLRPRYFSYNFAGETLRLFRPLTGVFLLPSKRNSAIFLFPTFPIYLAYQPRKSFTHFAPLS